MIEINLIPPNLRKRERGAEALTFVDLPREILFGVGGLFFAFLILIHILLAVFWFVKVGEQSMTKGTWARMAGEKNSIDSINGEFKSLKAKTTLITDITSKKAILWSQKLNIISERTPKGLWLKKIAWNKKALTIDGSAVSRARDEITIVGNFVAALKKDENFAKDFSSIELKSVNRVKKGVTDVAEFTLIAKVK